MVDWKGTILEKGEGVRRIDIVKELADTLYSLANCLLITAEKAHLKPDLCLKLKTLLFSTEGNYKSVDKGGQEVS